jgi:hypothetical protein
MTYMVPTTPMAPTTFERRLGIALTGPFSLLALALLGAMVVGLMLQRAVV